MRSRHADTFNHDEDAPGYDLDVQNEADPIRAGYAEALDWVADHAGIGPQSTVLELGSGTGNLTARLNRARRIVAVDVSRAMTAIARDKLSRPDVDWIEDDVLAAMHRNDLPAFDAVVSTYTLHHLEEDEKLGFYKTLWDRLAPGGRFAVADLMFLDDASRRERLAGYRDTGRTPLADDIESEFFWNVERAQTALGELGFSVVTHRFSDLTWGIAGRRPGGRPKVKVCCIESVEEAECAIRAGADALGLVSAMPSGPGVILESTIRTIAGAVAGRADTFLLTSSADPGTIADQVHSTGVTTVQLCAPLSVPDLESLRGRLPREITVVAVIHVVDETAVDAAGAASRVVDALLLDTGRPDAPVAELGGTGRVHDWSVSRRIRDRVRVPVYLAGGLTAGNVTRAVRTVEPYGVDLCSGVREGGKLNQTRVSQFFAELENAAGPAVRGERG